MSYRNVNSLYQEFFGCKVYKISLDGGFTCPNRDGTIATGGCIFCSGSGGGAFTYRGQDLKTQITLAKAQVAAKNKSGKFIAYFQAFTNTYEPVDRLEQLYRCAMEDPQIVGLSIGTRPDCLPKHVVVHRITGDGAKRELVAPLWSGDKNACSIILTVFWRKTYKPLASKGK